MSASDAFDEARVQLDAGRQLEAKLLLAAGIADLVEDQGVHPVVSGGTSVDLWAAGTLEEPPRWPRGWTPSEDLDLLNLSADPLGGAITIRRALEEAGFEPAGQALDVDRERGWIPPDLPIAVEIIGGEFEGDPDRVAVVEIDDHEARVRGPEDTLWEHLEWGAHTGDQRSWTRALAIARAQEDRLDLTYLRTLAREWGYEDALKACLAGEPLE